MIDGERTINSLLDIAAALNSTSMTAISKASRRKSIDKSFCKCTDVMLKQEIFHASLVGETLADKVTSDSEFTCYRS